MDVDKKGVDWREVDDLLVELGIETRNIRQALDELRNSGLISDKEYNEAKTKIEHRQTKTPG